MFGGGCPVTSISAGGGIRTMARVLILGGGFGGVVAAEALAQQLGDMPHEESTTYEAFILRL